MLEADDRDGLDTTGNVLRGSLGGLVVRAVVVIMAAF